jgi:hypothetical protein
MRIRSGVPPCPSYSVEGAGSPGRNSIGILHLDVCCLGDRLLPLNVGCLKRAQFIRRLLFARRRFPVEARSGDPLRRSVALGELQANCDGECRIAGTRQHPAIYRRDIRSVCRCSVKTSNPDSSCLGEQRAIAARRGRACSLMPSAGRGIRRSGSWRRRSNAGRAGRVGGRRRCA